MRRITLCVVLALAVITAACSSSGQSSGGTGSSTPDSTAPTGTGVATDAFKDATYTVLDVEGRQLVPGTQLVLTFAKDELQVTAGCGSIGGRVSVDGDKLSFAGDPQVTTASCDASRTAQDQWLAEWFGSGVTMMSVFEQPFLRGGDVTMALVKREGPSLSLTGTIWTLGMISEGRTAAGVPSEGAPTLQIVDGQATIFTGCNRGTAAATIDAGANTLTVGPLALTEVACPPEATVMEATVTAFFEGTAYYAFSGPQLVLERAGQRLLFSVA